MLSATWSKKEGGYCNGFVIESGFFLPACLKGLVAGQDLNDSCGKMGIAFPAPGGRNWLD
jgi:hypothetical protein